MKAQANSFALCIDNSDYRASLILGNAYRILPDPAAATDDLVRVVDESGEDYLYHKDHFVLWTSPQGSRKRSSRCKAPPNKALPAPEIGPPD
jgi:hypothetical protein